MSRTARFYCSRVFYYSVFISLVFRWGLKNKKFKKEIKFKKGKKKKNPPKSLQRQICFMLLDWTPNRRLLIFLNSFTLNSWNHGDRALTSFKLSVILKETRTVTWKGDAFRVCWNRRMECLPRLDTKIVRKRYLLPSSLSRNVNDFLVFPLSSWLMYMRVYKFSFLSHSWVSFLNVKVTEILRLAKTNAFYNFMLELIIKRKYCAVWKACWKLFLFHVYNAYSVSLTLLWLTQISYTRCAWLHWNVSFSLEQTCFDCA